MMVESVKDEICVVWPGQQVEPRQSGSSLVQAKATNKRSVIAIWILLVGSLVARLLLGAEEFAD